MMDANELDSSIEGILEAVLFAAGEAVETGRLATAADCSEETITKIIEEMNRKYNDELRGITIKKIEDGYQISTSMRYADNIRKCLNLDRAKPLSQTLLETLAIIAFMQPVTKQQISDIRGADAKHAVNKLMEKGLVCEMGRHEAPGRPLLFGTTSDFLRKFGFSSISDMPVTMRILEEQIKAGEDQANVQLQYTNNEGLINYK